MLTSKAEPIDKDLALYLGELAGPEQSARFAELARGYINEASAQNEHALGRRPVKRTFVDGRAEAPLESIRPNGVIHVEFELILDVLKFIAITLEAYSPVKTGRYKKSHALFADGREISLETLIAQPTIRLADEYVFLNTVPYARKIERGLSPEAPDGVYEATSKLARSRFSNIAKISFTYRGVAAAERGSRRHGTGLGLRQNRSPAVIVRTF